MHPSALDITFCAIHIISPSLIFTLFSEIHLIIILLRSSPLFIWGKFSNAKIDTFGFMKLLKDY